jgi:putative endopeptidase
MRSLLVVPSLFLGSVLALCAAAPAQNFLLAPNDAVPTSAPPKPVLLDLTAIDKTADPCVDFYQYACGNWRVLHPIPGDQTRWSRFNELSDRNNYLLYADLKKAADAPKTPLQTKYGNYFAACMDTAAIEKKGATPIEGQLAAIAAEKDAMHLAALNVLFSERFGGGFLMSASVGQDQKDSSQQIVQVGAGGLSLPDRDYYLSTDARSQKLREEYVAHVTKMFTLLGDAPEQAAKEAADVLRIETAIAHGTMDRVAMRDPAARYHIMTIAEVQALSPSYNWQRYLDGVNLGSVKTVNVSAPETVKTVQAQLTSEPLPALKSYMRWHVLHGAAAELSTPFADENFDFFSRTLNGQKEQQPRWKRCTAATDRALGEAVGQDWVKQNFPPAAKANTEKLVHALEAALATDIQGLPWMSDATKVEAKKKLDAITDKIGYPDHWRDYSTLTVKRDDYLGNAERAAIFQQKRGRAKLGKPVDPSEWSMTPPTVNAYYMPSQNNINFPAGILQPPFYDVAKDPAVNFGGIGVVIGHEMTHGFDDQGSKYDLHGSVRQWWTEADKSQFEERTGCEVKEYSSFQVADGQKLNGKLTLGENTADNGGIRIAYQALMTTLAQEGGNAMTKEIDGYTPEQRFFLAFGQVWCENTTEQAARVRAKTDPHSSGEWRTKGTVQNFDEFGKAFGCKVGQPMMPTNSCRVW